MFPSIEPALQAGREYLCGKAEEPAALERFEAALAALRIPKAEILAEVRAHAEYLHNAGRIPVEGVAGLRAALEPYALGHRERMIGVLEATYGPGVAGLPERLTKLREALAYERAKGD